ncbi:glycosyltransferase [Trebonia sp.]|uniref:glycosyltransferase n=1 Tax=Trebonia sp. TaxID=2767075 RepID=UPI00261F6386|nr:glycosyltransferase [Trebonia sp.]
MLGLAIACVVAAVAWVFLLAAHGGYWLTSQRLPAAVSPERWPGVVAVVPARNEADMLPVTLPALLAQDYPGEFRVILVDDGSEDGTAEIAAELGVKSAREAPEAPEAREAREARKGAAPLTVVAGQPRPAGWAGKVWAMAQGVAASAPDAGASAPDAGAGRAAAEPSPYLLFTDADIDWAPGALRELVAAAESDNRAVVSQMAMLRAHTGWERLIVPAFVYFFAQLYPFRKVNHQRGRTAAAAGGCMLVRRDALDKAGGLEQIRGALIDDVALATLLKRDGNRCWLGLTAHVQSARPYPRLASLWHMIARSAYTQLRYSPALLACTIACLLLLYAVPPAGAIAWLAVAAAGGGHGTTIPALLAGAAGLSGWALMTVSYLPMLRFYRLCPLRAPMLPLIAVLYAAMTADSARRHYSGRAVSWRGRAAGRA